MAAGADEGGGGALPARLMNFVSEDQLEEARKTRGARIEDGTAQRDKSLYEILKENKDKKDAEYNERFRHRPPKALDEDETEFLDTLEMSRREYERQLADKEAQELRSFQAAVSAQSTFLQELKGSSPVPIVQDRKLVGKKNPRAPPYSMVVKVKPQAKKAKSELLNAEAAMDAVVRDSKGVRGGHNSKITAGFDSKESQDSVEEDSDKAPESCAVIADGSLVSYSDESEYDD